jgi:predicted nucleic acid-binding protein
LDVVVDSSAVLVALTAAQPDQQLASRLGGARELHAPQLLDIEVLHVLRSMVVRGQLQETRADQARVDLAALRVRGHPLEPLLDRTWDLRDLCDPSDAVFIVLAEALEVPLVTCDPRVARLQGHTAQVEFYGASLVGDEELETGEARQ